MSQLNGVMMQYFHWYCRSDGSLWEEVAANAMELSRAGISGLWLPPAYKGIGGGYDVGYGVYDMYDLGEFDQKGSIRTKYGTKEQYQHAIQSLKKHGINSYVDVVLNHRMGGDAVEPGRATPYVQDNRLNPASSLIDIQAYTHFKFSARNKQYSDFEYHWRHFDAVDYSALHPDEKGRVFLLEGKQFDDYVALEKGNFAYLMGCDLDMQHPEVKAEITNWGKWILDQTQAEGFRLDAIKHMAAWFFPEWLDTMERHAGKDLFVVGEYWSNDLPSLHWYLNIIGGRMSVFDVPLHFKFASASRAGSSYDMRGILDGTLMKERPTHAVTFVDNHDSQPLQALESPVQPWFKPLAYALILLRAEGYPCIFYPDYYGAEYEDFGGDRNKHRIVLPSHRFLIDRFLKARRQFAYGDQYDYFDHFSCVGWTRHGTAEHPGGVAVLMSAGPQGHKWMNIGHPGKSYGDATGHISGRVTTNEYGWAEFGCPGGSVSVWVPAE